VTTTQTAQSPGLSRHHRCSRCQIYAYMAITKWHLMSCYRFKLWHSAPAQEMAKHLAKSGWPPLSDTGAVTKPRCETRWNLLVPQTCQPISAVSGRNSPYCEDTWKRYCCFPTVDTCLSCKDIAQQSWHPLFPASHVQHISDLHSKFALRPHHVWKYGRHPTCNHWE